MLGVARVPMPQSQQGSVINILTVSGTIYLDGEDITFGEVRGGGGSGLALLL